MSLKPEKDNTSFPIFVGIVLFTFLVLPWMSAQDAMRKRAEDAKPKPMAPCASVLDACYKDPTPGIGDAAWYIKQEDRMYGTRQHEAQVDKALGAINAQAICDHKKRQGVDCE